MEWPVLVIPAENKIKRISFHFRIVVVPLSFCFGTKIMWCLFCLCVSEYVSVGSLLFLLIEFLKLKFNTNYILSANFVLFCYFCVIHTGLSSTFHHQRPRDGYNTFTDTSTILPSFNSIINTKWNEPYFDISVPNNVTALVGKSAYLSCKVRNLGNKTVSVYTFFSLFRSNFIFFLYICTCYAFSLMRLIFMYTE